MDEFKHLHVRRDGNTVEVRLHHGKANEMGSQQLREIEALCHLVEQDGTISTVITWSDQVSRRGTPIFVAGANVTERVDWNDTKVKQHVHWQRAVLGRLAQVPALHVVVVSGVALGWGTEFLLTADYRIASSQASFALPETGLGILPGAGGTHSLWRHIGLAQTLRLGMTGERIDATEALRIGLVQEVVSTEMDGLERARSLAARVARNSPTAVAAFKRAVLAATHGTDPVDIEARAYEHCVDTGNAAIGRANFSAIRAGEPVPWTLRELWSNNANS
jgi:enoyl-CoA hydratase/carnithine racemase